MSSVREFSPNVHMVVALCDRMDGLKSEQEPFEVVPIEELEIPNMEEFIFRYSILELNTAVKPYVITRIFNCGYERVVYFDPDIRLYSSLDDMFDILDRHSIVLVPHLTGPLDDDKRPDEIDILRAGTYNLGYIGVRNTAESERFLRWWRERLRRFCVNDVAQGLFVDQRWMDLAPGLFDGVKVVRHPGWNVAYWNLGHRTMARGADAITVNGQPLVFFHYSGFKPEDGVFSIHQNRFEMQRLDPVTRQLCADYARDLKLNDWDGSSRAGYGFDGFEDGSKIPEVLRTAYRRHYPVNNELPWMSFDIPPDWLIQLMNEPADLGAGAKSPFVSRLGYQIYCLRPDLQAVFPDIADTHARAFGEWFVSTVEKEYGLSNKFTDGVSRAINAEPAPKNTQARMRRWLVLTYHASPRLRAVAEWIISPSIRAKVQHKLARSLSAGRGRPINRVEKDGLNIVGYMCAESGTGEAVRSILRAVNAAGIHAAAVDVRYNNVSRMAELPPIRITNTPRYGINLLHINADQTGIVLDQLGAEFYSNRYNIGFWFWELEDFPEKYCSAFEHIDEVWVASSFCQKAISKVSRIPVIHIPLCVDLGDVPRVERRTMGLPQDSFLILSILDLLSIPERKNPLGIMDVFKTVVGNTGVDVHLVLKISNFERGDAELQRVIREFADNYPVTLIDNYLQRRQLSALMNICDCYFSMHRSEGFGLPMAEAMYLEKPVVGTGWSSNMDFMNQNNSIPLRYKLVELEKDHGPYPKGSVWAEADRDHAAESLIRLMGDRDLAGGMGRQASLDIRRYYSPDSVGRSIKRRLELLGASMQ